LWRLPFSTTHRRKTQCGKIPPQQKHLGNLLYSGDFTEGLNSDNLSNGFLRKKANTAMVTPIGAALIGAGQRKDSDIPNPAKSEGREISIE